MSKIIIFPQEHDTVAVLYPTGELPLSEVARKDVPAGVPYIIMDTENLPENRDFRDAWEADFDNPDGFGIGAEAWFAEQEAKQNEVKND